MSLLDHWNDGYCYSCSDKDREIARLRAAMKKLARWQVDHNGEGSGEMCDFADQILDNKLAK